MYRKAEREAAGLGNRWVAVWQAEWKWGHSRQSPGAGLPWLGCCCSRQALVFHWS